MNVNWKLGMIKKVLNEKTDKEIINIANMIDKCWNMYGIIAYPMSQLTKDKKVLEKHNKYFFAKDKFYRYGIYGLESFKTEKQYAEVLREQIPAMANAIIADWGEHFICKEISKILKLSRKDYINNFCNKFTV